MYMYTQRFEDRIMTDTELIGRLCKDIITYNFTITKCNIYIG
jgi:hypothetical protein